MGEPNHMTTLYTSMDTQYKCNIFKQPGYTLSPEQRIRMGDFTWIIQPRRNDRDGKLAIDIIITVVGLNHKNYLTAEFSLQQPGNVKHVFEHTFDCFRNTFIYRRALTIPTSKELGAVYSHHRFLRTSDIDEPDGYKEDNPYPKIPLQWDLSEEAPIMIDLNDTFLTDVYNAEEGKMTFMYYFTVHAAQKTTYSPFRAYLCWPKASRTGRYLNGRGISVDGTWFSHWPVFKKFMANVDLLAPEDYDDLVDVLGVYYHEWNIDQYRLQYLVRAAEKFGFYDFPQEMISKGNVDMYFASMRSVLLAPPEHPLLSVNNDIVCRKLPDENFGIVQRLIFHIDRNGPPVLKCFKTRNGMAWTVSLLRKDYCEQEYLCVLLTLNGPYKPNENQLWKVEFAPSKHSILGRIPRREHERVLNSVQRTICFPTCWLWNDIAREMGVGGPYNFTLKTTCAIIPGWKSNVISKNHGVTGVTNGELQCRDGRVIAVNKDFLRETCKSLQEWTPVPNKPNRIELKDADFDTAVHFLDQLYHFSKLYTKETFMKVFKLTQETNCVQISDQFERSFIRTETQGASEMKFREGYSLEYLKFNMDMREQLHVGSLDDYLNNTSEPISKPSEE